MDDQIRLSDSHMHSEKPETWYLGTVIQCRYKTNVWRSARDATVNAKL